VLEALPHRQILACLALLALGACSTKIAGGQTVCTNPANGQFVACPGVSVCVDPLKGTVIPCVSGDVTFGKADGDASDAPSDSAPSDGAPGDSAPGDGAPSDSVPDAPLDAKDVPILDAPPSDSGACANGAKQCKDKATLQTCNKGVWGSDFICPTTQECNDGACGCPSPCKALGLVECLPDVPALKTCQMNPDKCLSWGVPIACKPGEICQNGQCKTGTASGCNPPCSGNQTCQGSTCVPNGSGGTLACAQILACTSNCPLGDTSCSDGCVAQGSSSGQTQYSAYDACFAATCQPYADAGKNNEATACSYSSCYDVQAACIGSGGGSCSQLDTCVGGCTGSATCVIDCMKNASKPSGVNYFTMQGCISANCGGQAGDALITCAAEQCTSPFVQCFSPINPNQTLFSCKDVVACQGNCPGTGSSPCTKACIGQGSAQVQAEIAALLDCRDLKCGNWCPGSNCDSCVLQYCAAEVQACN
jgi:hypothetical protein